MAVQTPVFEGPFDLLLHLILREQVDIYEVSLSRVVDAYLDELGRMPALDLEAATEFLLIAATLVELKSKRLLPQGGDVEADEEFGLWAERDLLLARLLECKTFKDAASEIERLGRLAGLSHPRMAGIEERFLDIAPDIRAARSKSRMPSAAPSSECAFGSKSNCRGSPHRRTTTLSAALLPTGTLACGRFGRVSSARFLWCSVESSWMPSCLIWAARALFASWMCAVSLP